MELAEFLLARFGFDSEVGSVRDRACFTAFFPFGRIRFERLPHFVKNHREIPQIEVFASPLPPPPGP